jgi:hypothetical protein
LILKYSSRFGTSETVLATIERVVHRTLDGRQKITPALFDDIEREIESQLAYDSSNNSFNQHSYTPKLRALRGLVKNAPNILAQSAAQHSTTP